MFCHTSLLNYSFLTCHASSVRSLTRFHFHALSLESYAGSSWTAVGEQAVRPNWAFSASCPALASSEFCFSFGELNKALPIWPLTDPVTGCFLRGLQNVAFELSVPLHHDQQNHRPYLPHSQLIRLNRHLEPFMPCNRQVWILHKA